MGWTRFFYVDVYGRGHWYSAWIWEFWYRLHPEWIIVAQNTGQIFNKIFIRRFQGFNHGRHWDRKRRN